MNPLALIAFWLLSLLLIGCAAQRFESVPPSSTTAEVTVKFSIQSARSVVFGGTFEDGRKCSGFRFIGADGRTTQEYFMRVPAKTLALTFLSAGEASGALFSPGGLTGKRCVGWYTFEPAAGAQYVFRFHDDPGACWATLIETTGGPQVNRTDKLVKRDAREQMPGPNRCADEYPPPAR
jgi:hypothetical protein